MKDEIYTFFLNSPCLKLQNPPQFEMFMEKATKINEILEHSYDIFEHQLIISKDALCSQEL